MKEIPQNKILKPTGLGDTLGDVVETFNLNLNSNYGAIRVGRSKKVIDSDDSSDIELPVAFAYYNDKYHFVTDDFVYSGGDEISDTFTKDISSGAPSGETVEANSDAAVFNGCLYVSGSDEIMKLNLTTWSTPITTQLTAARPHLLEPYGNRLYVTDEHYKVHSVSTSDVISATGTATLDLGLDNTWTITMLRAGQDSLWIGLLNIASGKGLVYKWDGQTENTTTQRIEIEAGVIAGVVLDNVPYIVDARGRLMKYNGASFSEVARFFRKSRLSQNEIDSLTNRRFIHPNGMTLTDYGTILINYSNTLETSLGYEDSIPSGVYEYDPEIGLYHICSPSYSVVGGATVSDYGQMRIQDPGAIMFRRPVNPSASGNGTFIFGTEFFKNGTSTVDYGVFCDDSLDITQKWGYFITSKLFSDGVEDVWQTIYPIYKKLLNSTDKIIVKYRTEESTQTEATINWSNTQSFTTSTDLSSYSVGDEVQVVQGTGSGKSAHITTITPYGSGYAVTLDEEFTNASGTAKVLVNKWIKAGECTYSQLKQTGRLTLPKNNVSPWIQFKVCMQFTGNNELYKTRVLNKPSITE